MNFTQDDLVAFLQPKAVIGYYGGTIRGVSALDTAKEGDIAFFSNRKYVAHVASSRASIVLVPENFDGCHDVSRAYFKVPNPSWAFAKVCAVVEKERAPTAPTGIHPTAIVDVSAEIAPGVYIGPFAVVDANVSIGYGVRIGAHCVVGRGCHIGENTCINPRATLYANCWVGNNVIIHSGAVIGSDGFGYETIDGIHHKLPHIGNVIIEDNVEIGANTAIDRARFAETRIGSGTKIDNLVQVGHNVRVGSDCLIVSQAGIAGSSTLGHHVVLGGQAGIAGHVHIGDGVQIAAQCGVPGNVPGGNVLRGTPPMPINEANRFYVLRKHIPKLFKRVEALEKKSQPYP
ncbi:MAG: UDP-3-O-(3-hydroxymyristoyl)glucosamine N-acyltransferase [Puniceicoccales bacterium]|jgi:UDP-3-O-[3-hydroxymyristoyl] glucosamine N-acyltransferase|nr:UDP-3-O-(3-hydroxymyristoyl)glucosamine N-acyltransferase [Puniceicoccales bacterium]